MAFFKVLLCASWIVSVSTAAIAKTDKKETISGVSVESGKEDSTRHYRGFIKKSFPYSLGAVKGGVLNFNEKCNNTLKDRRQFTDKEVDCKYHNENLVETVVLKTINPTGWIKETNEVDRYVLGRLIYNRGSFGYYELVKITEGLNEQNQKTVTIVTIMLSDKEAEVYTKPVFEKDSAFEQADSTYVLTAIGPQETTLSYEYKAQTDHWILNKEVSVPQVFASISKSINDLVKAVDAESLAKARDLASN